MKKMRGLIILVVISLMSLAVVGVAAAQEEVTCTPVEEAGNVEGTVIGVDDEEGTVDILQEDGTCVTVSFEEGDYDHPIVALLAEYFGGVSVEDLDDALDTLELDEGVVVDIEEQDDGTWLVTFDDDTTLVLEEEDAELAQELTDALETLEVDLDLILNDDGEATVGDVGEQIAEYHEDGIGFGVLVKIYAIAEESAEACAAQEEEETPEEGGEATAEPPTDEGDEGDEEEVDDCAVTVEQLVEDYLNGMSIGEMFRLYGKPSLLGVGHVRQALNAGDGETAGTATESGDGNKGICNARANGGNANANGQNVECP